jgi:chromosome segregation ATPase
MANLLTGKNGTYRLRAPSPAPPSDLYSQIAMQAVMCDYGRLHAELETAIQGLETATRALEVERARTGELHTQLATEAGMRNGHAAEMAAAKASISTLERELRALTAKLGELQTEHATTKSALEVANKPVPQDREFATAGLAALARLEQQLAQLATRPAPTATEAPAYEMVVVARDVNLRPHRVRLTPLKENP